MMTIFFNDQVTSCKTVNAEKIVGIATGAPYLTKDMNENLTCCFFSIEDHIIPASAPIGVRNAPMFEPMIAAYISWIFAAPVRGSIIELNNTLIGILFIRFAAKKDEKPYLYTIRFPSSNDVKNDVIPFAFKANINMNIERTNGIKGQGALFKQLLNSIGFLFRTMEITVMKMNKLITNPKEIYHISIPIYELIASNMVHNPRCIKPTINNVLSFISALQSVWLIFSDNFFLNISMRIKNEVAPAAIVGSIIVSK